MAQRLNKRIDRETTVTVFSRGQYRPIIVSLNPNNTLGLRLKGTRQRFDLPLDSCYDLAVKASLFEARHVKRRK